MHRLSALELREKFASGEVSATEITTYFLDRIAKYDGQVKAFLKVLNERALAQAKALDEKRARGEKLGRLAGVPVAIKNNIHIKGEITTCASKFLENFQTPFSATVTDLLEAEDAILIGQTNLDEFAMGSSTENSAFFPTHNPWNLKCTPGGSSGGSAAAVAARMCPIALGSDTGGSIRQPAALCGIVGAKSTYGRVSRFGLVAFGSSLDQIGPFTTNVADAALVSDILGKHCARDSTSLPDAKAPINGLVGQSISGMRIGVPSHLIKDLAEGPRKNFDAAVDKLRSMGCEVVDVNLDIIKHSVAVYYIVATAEASTNLARFDGVRYGVRSPDAKTLNELYEFSKRDGFGDEVKRRILLGTFVLSAGYQDAYYKKAQKVRTLFIESYKTAFEKCDIIALPTSPFTAWEIGAIKDPLQMYLSDLYTISANLAGVPATSVPSGFNADGMPYGIQFCGPQLCDDRVYQAASAFEEATGYSSELPPLIKETETA